ncbi:hypothetical protein AKO1_000077 [Acrasis kona]|uniref:Uncharacterized protein n=1 Tax=Acrasis kona TaxID=1008807 RepID=A0AAW2ZEI7_9EUKA
MSVIVCGNNSQYQISMPSGMIHVVPTEIDRNRFSGRSIKHVACGERFTTFVTDDNRVFSCGLNKSMQTGVLGSEDVIWRVEEVHFHNEKEKPKINYATAGSSHTIMTTVNNEIYCTGSNYFGQCGFGEETTKVFLSRLPQESFSTDAGTIAKVVCGGDETLFLTYTGRVWVTGRNKYGQLVS